MAEQAQAEMASNPRYQWRGELSRGKALRVLTRSRLHVLSSQMEGGANALCEAIACAVPTLASRIPGSVGILGPDYPGYFPVGDTQALADLLHRAETDAEFLPSLRSWCERLRPLVDPAREREAWRQLLEELTPSTGVNWPPSQTLEKPFTLVESRSRAGTVDFAAEVRRGLTSRPKYLPCRFFYDPEGSRLFEAICELPEYYLTRAEREILEQRSDDVASRFSRGATLIELGSGSAEKTRLLIERFLRRDGKLLYIPVDISRSMLSESARTLLREFPGLQIRAIAGEYQEALAHLQGSFDRTKLILWLGSNVGNLDRSEARRFLSQVREQMGVEDGLLVGIDLRKDRRILEPAYDDAQGVTAQFNRNILARINHELGGKFDLGAFHHRALYDEEEGRIEMYLVSSVPQTVQVRALDLAVSFEAGETIHTENSYKYSLAEIAELAGGAGLCVECQWLDGGGRFSLNLLAVTEPRS